MSSPEAAYDHAEPVLRSIATDYTFDTFVYLAELNKISQEEGILPTEWRELLGAWHYDPETFLEGHGRGNCIDFACYGRKALSEIGIQTEAIGEISRLGHVTLVAELDGPGKDFTLFETSWKAPKPVALLPLDTPQESGGGVFRTVSYDTEKLVQNIITPRGNDIERILSMNPITSDEMTYITRLRRQYQQGLHMFTPLGEDVPDYYIRYNTKKEALVSNIDGMPKFFQESDITSKRNQEISAAFGFDVKEELVAALGLRRALPDEYWVDPALQKPGLLAIGL
jgi:hypothetical protein